MIYVDLENNPPAADWILRAEALSQLLINAPDAPSRSAIIDANEALWGELKGHLAGIRNRKCWYSESINDGAHCHVDHFRPKKKALNEAGVNQGGYWWLAFNWRNYRYTGPAPNVRKKDYFPVIQHKAMNFADNIANEDVLFLDPLVMGDSDKLAYEGNEGKVIPRSNDGNSRDYKRAVFSIYRYNLNTEGLKEGRRQKHRRATNLIIKSQELVALQAVNHDIAREREVIAIWKELRDLAHPDAEYSATVKYCLKSCGFDWALNIAMAA
jgi:hypothetical protein